jgi:RsiW-degrading membrane proteinase PrsW (M82 family)
VGYRVGFLNLTDPPPRPERIVDYDSPSPTLTIDEKVERDLRELPPRGFSRTYFVLLIALLPLLVSLLQPGKRYDAEERLAHTLAKLPVVEQVRIGEEYAKNKQSMEKLLMHLPGHRIENAHLGYDSWIHWLYAAAAVGVFFGFLVLAFPSTRAKPRELLRVGVYTGTIGMVLLLAFQFAAAVTQRAWPIPRGPVTLFLFGIFYVLKFFGYSYTVALNPGSGILLSWMGFTFGVGFCEETCKMAPLIRHFRYRGTMDWRGACLWGMASGAGFGISEGIFYASDYNGIQTADIYAVRFISCVALHAIWTGAAAITLFGQQDSVQEGGVGLLEYRWRLLKIIAVPMILHGLYDTSLKKEMGVLALLVAVFSFGWIAFQVEKMCRLEARIRLTTAAPVTPL